MAGRQGRCPVRFQMVFERGLLKSTERRPAWLEQQVPPRKRIRGGVSQGWEGLTLWFSQGPNVRKI